MIEIISIQHKSDEKIWYEDVKFRYHRENGPAIEWNNGTKEWYTHGIRHREDGPAIEYNNGQKYWYLKGKLLNPEKTINDLHYRSVYPDLVASILICSVHSS